MTNRGRLAAMTDEQLADFILSESIEYCRRSANCNGKCAECVVEWLRSEDKPKKGDVRKIADNYYMVVRVTESESKLMYSDGSFGWVTNDVFLVDEPCDMSVDNFLKLVFKNL